MQFDPNVLSLVQLALIAVCLITIATGLACLALTLVLLTRIFKVAGREQPIRVSDEVPGAPPNPVVEKADDGPLGSCSSCGCGFDPSVTKIVEVSASENGSRAVVECQQCGGRTALSTEQARLILPRDP